MSLQTRVNKLEQAMGIKEPCEVCEAVERSRVRFEELMSHLNIVEPKRTPVPMHFNCAWCRRPVTVDVSDFTVSEQILYERMNTAYNDGTLCLPENKNLWDELAVAFDRVARERYGQYYDEYRKVNSIYLDELSEITRRRAPAGAYLCRVADCVCSYPKTEEEWRANVKRRLAA